MLIIYTLKYLYTVGKKGLHVMQNMVLTRVKMCTNISVEYA